jgi:hypothetical protein
MDARDTIERFRTLQRLLDNAFRIPGTNVRFGLDPLIGLVPWVGDLLTSAYALALLVHANRLRVPKVIQIRMLVNVAIDTVVGAIPVAGDVADVFWKSNSRNFALFERHAGSEQRPSFGDYLFVACAAVALMAIALVPLFVMYWLYETIVARCCT